MKSHFTRKRAFSALFPLSTFSDGKWHFFLETDTRLQKSEHFSKTFPKKQPPAEKVTGKWVSVRSLFPALF